jgi:hypothetical protein
MTTEAGMEMTGMQTLNLRDQAMLIMEPSPTLKTLQNTGSQRSKKVG